MSNNNKDHLSRFWVILSNAVPPVGFFLYFKYRAQFPYKAAGALKSAVAGVPIALIAGYLLNTYILN